MSDMVQCDGCKKLMYADSRSEKGDYHFVWLDQREHYHLCRTCYDAFMRDILHLKWNNDEQQYTDE